MTGMAAGAIVLTAFAVVATPAQATRFRGTRTVANPSARLAMSVSRAEPIARQVVRRVFAVRTGSELYACSGHSFSEVGCDFQFVSRFGNVTCGNAVVRAFRSRIVVRYDAFTGGCGDF
jgi:hypothetical protein